MPNGNIYAPVMMVAEKAADLIRGLTPLPPSRARFYRHELSELRVGEFLAALGERTPAPASGAATALTAAIAAALVELAARFADEGNRSSTRRRCGRGSPSSPTRTRPPTTAFLADRTDETRARTIAVPEEIASCADQIVSLAEHVRGQLRSSVAGDAEAAAELARAAAVVARRLAELNRS